MILQICFTLFILTLVAFIRFYFKTVLKTKHAMLQYKQSFQKAGYRVKIYPFTYYLDTWFSNIVQYSYKYDNAYKLFEQLKGYDIAIGCSFNKPSIAIVNPRLMKEYFQAPVGDFIKFKLTFKNLQRLFGTGMIYSQGQQSKRKRKIISQVFHYKFITSLVPNTRECFNQMFDEIDHQQRKLIDVGEMFKDLFCDITINSFFGHQGYKCEINGKRFSKFFVSLIQDVSIRNYHPMGMLFPAVLKMGIFAIDRSVNERVKLFNNFIYDYIRNRVEKFKKLTPQQIQLVKQKDIFAAMYFSGNINQNVKNEDNFNYAELIQEFALFVTAGTQTTAVHTTNTIYYISQNPEVKKKLQQQIAEYIKSDEDYNVQTLNKMKYLYGVTQQSFRFAPPAPIIFARIAAKQTKLGSVTIAEGTSLIHDLLTAKGKDEKYYPNPQKFMPQRWMNTNNQDPYTFLPFSAGIRNCIGQHMALILSKILIISFIKRYDFEVSEKIRHHLKFIITPLPFKISIKKRETQKI